MRENLRADLKTAMKARDRVAIAALRSALSAIDNAEAVPIEETPTATEDTAHVAGAANGVGASEAARRELTDTDLRTIVEGEVRERTAAADEYARLGNEDAATRLRAEADVLRRQLNP